MVIRTEDDQALYRAELRRSGVLRRALLRDGLVDGLFEWLAWFGGWLRRA